MECVYLTRKISFVFPAVATNFRPEVMNEWMDKIFACYDVGVMLFQLIYKQLVYVCMYVCMYVDIRWEEFSKWYLGEEFTQKIPGKGIPTLARVGLLPCYYYCYVRNLT